MKSFKTFLPAAAADVYYRDEIGNISTSNLRVDEEYVELELRPRSVCVCVCVCVCVTMHCVYIIISRQVPTVWRMENAILYRL